MWKNIFVSLFTIGTYPHRSTSLLTDCATLVGTCPLEKDQWTQKNNSLKCAANYGYVCLRDSDGNLFETCMANFPVQANSGNCPILFDCQNNNAYLGLESAYYSCPEEVPGCPLKNHTEYSIHQLYKYPKCIESSLSTQTGNTSPTSTTSISKASSDLDLRSYIVGYFVGSALMLSCIACCGCPYFTETNGRKEIKQIACKSNKHGCPEAIKDETFLSSEVYIFPNCLSIPVKSTTKESSTNNSTIFKFVEVNDSRTTQTRFDSVTTNGSTADVEELLLMNPIFFLGGGLFVLICGFTGNVAFQLYKRIKNLRERMETENCMSVELYNVATTQRYEESENEPLYDCVHNDEETSRPYSESVSNVEANSCCYCQTKQV